MSQRWIEHLGLTWDDLPHWKAHREADKKHSDIFMPDLVNAVGDKESLVLQAAKESEGLYRTYQAGIADAMEAISKSWWVWENLWSFQPKIAASLARLIRMQRYSGIC